MNTLILAIVMVLAVMSLMQKNTVPSVLAFILMMFMLGMYYISLDLKLLGLFQIFVYTGGIVVLTLFGVTVVGTKFPKYEIRPWAVTVVAVVVIGLLVVIFSLPTHAPEHHVVTLDEQVKALTDHYAYLAVFLGVTAASILYGSIRMLHTLKHEGGAQ
jgi:NADH-quinone oxidoreductase subunit J